MSIIFFILVLVGLILVHELGHFSVAKLFKIRVDEFGIFFPPRLFAKRFGETEYSLNWLPLGGFVRIFGESAQEGVGDPRSLVSKPRLVQAAVMLAGIVCNILFAWLVLSAGYIAGLPTSADHTGWGDVRNIRATVAEIIPNSPAQRAGLEPNDVVLSVETGTTKLQENASADEITSFIAAHQEESVIVRVQRDQREQTFLAKPAAGLIEGRKAIGMRLADIGTLTLPPHLALLQGGVLAYHMTVQTAQGLGVFFKNLVSGGADFSAVSGPIGIVALGSTFVSEGYVQLIFLTASISIALALFNLVPIPGLDGGRLLFVIVESITRRPISPRLSVALTVGGFALLITLMVVVSYHDIIKLVG